ncbi:MAG: conjugal transfer protein TraX [Lachnospiraceae bacterium]|nr:conjugal transfer protein TraX [Lachnospiraceae bacterium]
MNTRTFTGLTASALKWIAFITMLIDHVGYAVLYPLCFSGHPELFNLYQVSRAIGRIAFPIFIFQLIEGFVRTSCKWKYAFRLFVFCFISEIPFDLAFSKTVFDWSDQNVFFTLFLGFAVIWGMDEVYKRLLKKNALPYAISNLILYGGRFGLLVIGCLAAYFLKTDYSYVGVLAIAAGYLLRIHPVEMMQKIAPIVVCGVLLISSLSEAFGFIALLPIYLYQGKKGSMPKWVGYLFYPCHLLLLFGIYSWFIK